MHTSIINTILLVFSSSQIHTRHSQMKRGIWGILALKTKMSCKSVKFGTEKYKILTPMPKMSISKKEQSRSSIGLHGRKGSGTKL